MLLLDCGVCIIYSNLGKAPLANDRLMDLARVDQGLLEGLEKMKWRQCLKFSHFSGAVKKGPEQL
jgi:hypothetical protein